MSAPHDRDGKTMGVLKGLAMGLLMIVSLFAAAGVNAAPRDPARVAAICPPWWSPAQAFAAAGSAGDVTGAGRSPFILILRGDPSTLAQRARAAGALLILDPDRAGVCAPVPQETLS